MRSHLRRGEAARRLGRRLGGLALLLLAGCGPVNDDSLAPEHLSKLDSQARRALEQTPDSVIGVLLWTRDEPDAEELTRLSDAGLATGAVIGEVVSGRIVARELVRLARLPFVVYIERARDVELHPPPVPRDLRSSERAGAGRDAPFHDEVEY